MSPKEVQNLAKQTPWSLKFRDQSLGLNTVCSGPTWSSPAPGALPSQKHTHPGLYLVVALFARLLLEAVWPVETKVILSPSRPTYLLKTVISELLSESFLSFVGRDRGWWGRRHCVACYRILVPLSGTEPWPLAVKVPRPNHWITREILSLPLS